MQENGIEVGAIQVRAQVARELDDAMRRAVADAMTGSITLVVQYQGGQAKSLRVESSRYSNLPRAAGET